MLKERLMLLVSRFDKLSGILDKPKNKKNAESN